MYNIMGNFFLKKVPTGKSFTVYRRIGIVKVENLGSFLKVTNYVDGKFSGRLVEATIRSADDAEHFISMVELSDILHG